MAGLIAGAESYSVAEPHSERLGASFPGGSDSREIFHSLPRCDEFGYRSVTTMPPVSLSATAEGMVIRLLPRGGVCREQPCGPRSPAWPAVRFLGSPGRWRRPSRPG